MNLDEIMAVKIGKVEEELDRQRKMKAEVAYMEQRQKDNADRILKQKQQRKFLHDTKRLEHSGYREILNTLVDRLNHDDLRYLALKHALLKILSDNEHNEGISFDNITFSISTTEQFPCYLVFYCKWDSTQRDVFVLFYDDDGQSVVLMNQFEHKSRIHISCDQQQAAEEIISFLMTT